MARQHQAKRVGKHARKDLQAVAEIIGIIGNYSTVKEPPKGWYTVRQVAEMTGLSVYTTKNRLTAKGIGPNPEVERKTIYLLIDGVSRKTNIYKFNGRRAKA